MLDHQRRRRAERRRPSRRLVEIVNRALADAGLGEWTVDADGPQRIRAGYWQRSAGAGRWFVNVRRSPDSPPLCVISWDTMAECAARGVTIDTNDRGVEWIATAKPKPAP